MKVWIVEVGPPYELDVKAVFSTKELAEAYIERTDAKNLNTGVGCGEAIEFEVDKEVECKHSTVREDRFWNEMETRVIRKCVECGATL